MNRTLLVLAVTLAAGAVAVALAPYRMLTPGVLAAGHQAGRDDCLACHTLLQGTPAGKCLACHRVADIGVRSVAQAPLPEARPRIQRIHAALHGECAGCHAEHQGLQSARARFSHGLLDAGTARGCSACHLAQRPTDALHAGATGECSACHQPAAWKPATYDHARWFRFDRHHPPVCTDCHSGGVLTQYSCYGCHEHSERKLAAEHREEGIRDITGCARCHRSGNEHDAKREGGAERHGGHERHEDGDDD